MGMPKTKADCDSKIAYLQGELEDAKATLAAIKRGESGYSRSTFERRIADLKAEIAEYKAHKKTLK